MSNAKEKPVLRNSKTRDPLGIEFALADMVRRVERAKSFLLSLEATPSLALVDLLDTAAARMALGLPALNATEAENVDSPEPEREQRTAEG